MGNSSPRVKGSYNPMNDYRKLKGMTEEEANEFLTKNVIRRVYSSQRYKYVFVVQRDGIKQEMNNELIIWERLEVFTEKNKISGFDYERNDFWHIK